MKNVDSRIAAVFVLGIVALLSFGYAAFMVSQGEDLPVALLGSGAATIAVAAALLATGRTGKDG